MALQANPDRIYQSTKTYCHNAGLSCCFRQWRADSHCRFMHGYALQVKLTFEADKLDENGWVQDFGALKNVKTYLENMFDHRTLVTRDDPHFDMFKLLADQGIIQMRPVDAVGVEAFADLIMTEVTSHFLSIASGERVKLVEVEVNEHSGNSAIVKAR